MVDLPLTKKDEEIPPAENDAENTAEHAAENSAVNVAGKYFQQ